MEMLYKMRVTLYKTKHQKMVKDTKFDPDDVD